MPQEQQLVWLTPLYRDNADAQAARASSDRLIAFFDGRKLFGNILRFLPGQEVAEFRPMQNGEVLQVPFDEIKNKRLIRKQPYEASDEEINQLRNDYQTGTPLESAAVLEWWQHQYANASGKFTAWKC